MFTAFPQGEESGAGFHRLLLLHYAKIRATAGSSSARKLLLPCNRQIDVLGREEIAAWSAAAVGLQDAGLSHLEEPGVPLETPKLALRGPVAVELIAMNLVPPLRKMSNRSGKVRPVRC